MSSQPSNPFYVNARFLTQPLTGVQRYAYNVVKRLPGMRLISPAPATPDYGDIDASEVELKPHVLPSHLWEQFVLPGVIPRGSLLWSPTSMGPWRHQNHVLTVHDLSFYDMPECYRRSYALWFQTMFGVVARRARHIMADSEYTRQRLIEVCRVPEAKIEVVYLAADAHFHPVPSDRVEQTRQKLGLPATYILALGTVSPRKNFKRLLQAWKQVEADYEGAEMVIVGEKNLFFSGDDTLGEMPPRTRHLTGIDDETLVNLYAGATAFAYPSVYEGFGLPVLEAMSVGTPVLTSCNTSIPEVAGDAALLVDPFSVGEIAAGLRRLLDDTAFRQTLTTRGLQRAQTFSWDKTAHCAWNVLSNAV